MIGPTRVRERSRPAPPTNTTGGGMDTRLDSVTWQEHGHASRRRLVQSLAAIGLGTFGLVGLDQGAEAGRKKRCKKRCINHCNPNKSKRECRRDCRRECEN